jgi:hypothetical protein
LKYWVGWLSFGIVGAVGLACSDGSVTPPLQDFKGPYVRVRFPESNLDYDRDADGLIDLHVEWSDSGSVDLESAHLRRADAASVDRDLLSSWNIERFDPAGFVIHESIGALLASGTNELVLTVADQGGNVTETRIPIQLPSGSLFTTLRTGLQSSSARGVRAVGCSGHVYVSAGTRLTVINSQSLEIEGVSANPWAGTDLYSQLCVEGDSVMHVTPHGDRFHMSRRDWSPGPEPLDQYTDLIASRKHANLLYLGQIQTAAVAIIDRTSNRRIGFVQVPKSTYSDDFIVALAVLAEDRKLYFSRYKEGGVVVVNPIAGGEIKRIVLGSNTAQPGSVSEILLSSDDRSAYVAVNSNVVRGIVEIDTETDAIKRTCPWRMASRSAWHLVRMVIGSLL